MNSNTYETMAAHIASVWLPLTHQELRDSMERNGMRHSEIMSLIEDLDAGHVLHADNGRQYRAAQCTPTADKCPVHGYASCPIENLPSDELDAVAAALNGATLPELDDDVIAAERAAQQQHDDEQKRSHFIVDIDMESDALSSDRTELSRLLRLVADRIEVGVYDEKLRDVNGVSVGAHRFELKG